MFTKIEKDQIQEIVQYSGVITQNVISASINNIESKIQSIGLIGTISTITIEYFQNMMHYAKNEDIDSRQIVPAGSIEVVLINNEYYKITARNIISIDDKNKIEPKLQEIISLDRAGIRTRYKELRRSGENTHGKGGGIGMYEIAKISHKIEFSFENINDDKYYFTMSSIVEKKK